MSHIDEQRLAKIKTFIEGTEFRGGELIPLAGDASFRRYIRVRKQGKQAMLMDAPPTREDVRPYIAVAEYLYRLGYSVPDILARDEAEGFLLLEDLGDASFSSVLLEGGSALELYKAAMDVLIEWRDKTKGVSNPQALPLPLYDHALLIKEVDLFSHWFLPQVLGKEKALQLRAEYTALWQKVLASSSLSTRVWVHRDYHVDNLMWLPARKGIKRVGLLDFQDGVYGDAAYDVVSLLEDARRDVPPALAQEMIDYYLTATGVERQEFMSAYAILGAQRNSKIIGIFSRLAARDNKEAYLHYLPRVWHYLEQDLTHPLLAELKAWLDLHITDDMRGVIAVRHTSQELALSA